MQNPQSKIDCPSGACDCPAVSSRLAIEVMMQDPSELNPPTDAPADAAPAVSVPVVGAPAVSAADAVAAADSVSEVLDYSTLTPPSKEGFGVRSARGTIIMAGIQITTSALSFGSQIALGWLLSPADLGTVAAAVSIAGLVTVLRDAGAPSILIQRQNEFDHISGSLFWLAMLSSLVCAAFTACAAPIAAHMMHNPVLLPLLLITALRFPIGSMGTISFAKLMIDMRWKDLGLISLLQAVVTAGGMVGMAAAGFGVYSLVVPPIFADAIRGFLAWRLAGAKTNFTPHKVLIVQILESTLFIMLAGLTISARGMGDYLTLSFTRSKYETGLYFYAFTIAIGLAKQTMSVIPGVLAPVFSKVKHDEHVHAQTIIRAMHMCMMITILPIVVQALVAQPFFNLFLNPRWHDGAGLFALISLGLLIGANSFLIQQAMWTSGMYRQYFYYSAGYAALTLGFFVIGTFVAGATGVAWAGVAAATCDFFIMPIVMLPKLKVPWRDAMAPLWRPAIAVIPAVLTALALHYLLPATKLGDVLRIIIVGVIGSAAYLGILLLIWGDVTRRLLGHIAGALRLNRFRSNAVHATAGSPTE
jgi:lipopolysaccharide exporter